MTQRHMAKGKASNQPVTCGNATDLRDLACCTTVLHEGFDRGQCIAMQSSEDNTGDEIVDSPVYLQHNGGG
jgi:hypothetical protein